MKYKLNKNVGDFVVDSVGERVGHEDAFLILRFKGTNTEKIYNCFLDKVNEDTPLTYSNASSITIHKTKRQQITRTKSIKKKAQLELDFVETKQGDDVVDSNIEDDHDLGLEEEIVKEHNSKAKWGWQRKIKNYRFDGDDGFDFDSSDFEPHLNGYN